MKFELNKKELRYDWFNGTGKGGQNRNKTANCLRLTHIPTKIQVTSQNQRDRPSNEKSALEKLTKRVKSFLHPEVQKERFKAKEVIRSYRETDNMVKDHSSGFVGSYTDIVLNADPKSLEKIIKARRESMSNNEI